MLRYRWFFHSMLASVILASGLSVKNVAANTPSALHASRLSLPQGPTSLTGMGEAFTPRLNTGLGSQSLPLQVPTGRNGAEPELTLTYNAGFGNGIYGLGQQLSVLSVQRQTDQGLPEYIDHTDGVDNDQDGHLDEFDELDTFVDASGEPLVRVADGVYRSETGDHFDRYVFADNHWTIQHSNGWVSYLGSSPSSRVESEGRVFRWWVQAQEDSQGNRIEYTYASLDDGAQVYLNTIAYNFSGAHGQGKAGARLDFHYEPRSDVMSDYRAGFEVKTAFRLSDVNMYSNDIAWRHYQIDYAPTSVWMPLSRIETITQRAGKQSLPPAVYTYADIAPQLTDWRLLPTSFYPDLAGADTTLVDINSDGLPDVLETASNNDRYWLHQGVNDQGLPQWQARKTMRSANSDRLSQSHVAWGDINGDGRVDLMNYARSRQQLRVNSLTDEHEWQAMTPQNQVVLDLTNERVALMDINHDKRVDLVQVTTNFSGNRRSTHRAQLNLVDGWSNVIDLPMPAGSNHVELGVSGSRLEDMNGDGLLDLVSLNRRWLEYRPGRGLAGFAAAKRFEAANINLFDFGDVYFADFNQDGRSDLIQHTGNQLRIRLNLGATSDKPDTPQLSDEVVVEIPRTFRVSNIRLADVNGNGSTDVIWEGYYRGSRSKAMTELFSSAQPSYLTAFHNGLGASTRFEYGALVDEMIRDQRAGRPWAHTVPVAMQVLKKVTVTDGVSDIAQVTEMDYHDGYYHSAEKEFRGFAQTDEHQLGDSAKTTRVTQHHFDVGDQQNSLKGVLLKQSVQDATQGVFSEVTNTWEVRTLATGQGGDERDAYFNALLRSDERLLEQGRGTPVNRRTTFDYDHCGNNTLVTEYGRLEGHWGDERVTRSTYSCESARDAWHLHLPVSRQIESLSGYVLAKEQWFYDDETFSGTNLGEVVQGNVTLHRAWHDPSNSHGFVNLERFRYDSFGNTVAILDPLWGEQPGHSIAVEYDSEYHLYPVTERRDVGGRTLIATADYDLALGVLRDYSDYNGAKTHYQHDAFGRLAAIVKPGDHLQSPTLSYEYHLAEVQHGALRNWITTHQRESTNGGTIDSHAYFDGLSRPLMTRSEGERGRWVVSNAVTYNARGQVAQRFLPYIQSGADWQAPSDVLAHEGFTYDAQNRLLSRAQPASADDASRPFDRYRYEPLITQWQDEEQTASGGDHTGALVRWIYDGLTQGEDDQPRLRRVDQRVGVTETGEVAAPQVASTQYHYDLLGNLTLLVDAQYNHRYAYFDGLSRMTELDDANRGLQFFAYDAAGNTIAQRDDLDQEQHYRYDGANRLVLQQALKEAPPLEGYLWTPATDLSQAQTVARFTYDTRNGDTDSYLLGRLASVTDTAGVTHWHYDGRGRIVENQRQVMGQKTGLTGTAASLAGAINTPSYRTRFTYDSADRVRTHTFADGTHVSYEYSARGLLSRIPGVVESLSYNPVGALTQRVLTQGVTTDWRFDERQRLTGLRTETANGLVLQDKTYRFDRLAGQSNLLGIEDDRTDTQLMALGKALGISANQSLLLSGGADYGYDDLYRLTRAERGLEQFQYRYDYIGNLLYQGYRGLQRRPADSHLRYGQDDAYGASGTHYRDGSDWFTPGPQALTQVVDDNNRSLERYGYDAKGQMTHWDDLALIWNTQQRLEQVQGKSTKGDDVHAVYGYDYQGQRRYRSAQINGKRLTSVYLSQDSELRDGRLIKYLFLGDHRIARTSQVGGQFQAEQVYLQNHLGSTEITLSGDGQPQTALSYTPYGELLHSFGNLTQTPYRFTGKETDAESELAYFEQRYLNGKWGRFISPDPVLNLPVRFTDPQRWNTYGYARGNPVNYTDPTGEFVNFAVKFVADVALGVAIQAATGQKINIGAALKESAEGVLNPAKTVAKAAKLAKALKKMKKGGCSFAPETLVITKDGYKPIVDIRVGDVVLSKNDETGELAWREVTDTFKDWHKATLSVTYSDAEGNSETLVTTDEHPFYVLTKGWVPAGDLDVDWVIAGTESSDQFTIQTMQHNAQPQWAYNLTVDQDHTYFVGQAGAWVHNDCGEAPKRRPQNSDDVTVLSERAARRQAFRENNVPTSQANNFTRQKVHGKNPNLKGPNGEPSEVIKTRDVNGKPVEIQHHSNGHNFKDTNTYELPHYHGKSTNHISY